MFKKLYKSYAYKALQIVILSMHALFLIPILLKFWDLKVYGKWIAIYSLYNIIQVIEFSHSQYVGNAFNRLVHSNIQQAKETLGSAYRANFLVQGVQMVLVFGIYYSGLLIFFLDEDIRSGNLAIVLGILFFYRMVIGSFRGITVKILNPFGLIYKSFQYSLIEKIIEFIILVVVAVAGLSLVELALIWGISKTFFSIFILLDLKRLIPDYFPWWRYGSLEEGLKNAKNSLFLTGSNFMERTGNDGINLLVSAFVGTSFLPLFTATKTLVNFGLKISELFLSPIVPEMIFFHTRNKTEKILDIFRSYWFLTGTILTVLYTVSLFFLDDFFPFWTNGKLVFNEALYGILALVFLIRNFSNVFLTYLIGINLTKIVFTTSVIRFGALFVTLLLYPKGLEGILFALVVSELSVAAFYLPGQIFKLIKFSVKQKFLMMLNLFSVIWLGIMFYLKQDGKPLWILMLFFIPVVLYLKYQFKMISQSTKDLFLRSIMKFSIFRSK